VSEREAFIDSLRKSKNIVGYIHPIIVDKETFEIVDGKHRSEADPRWPRREMEFKSPKDQLVYRLNANVVRRVRSRKERASELAQLASYLEDEGIPREEIARTVCNLVPALDESYVLRLLPSKYKAPKKRVAGIKGAKKRIAAKVSKPKPLVCPSCRVELEKVLCPSCWTGISLRVRR